MLLRRCRHAGTQPDMQVRIPGIGRLPTHQSVTSLYVRLALARTKLLPLSRRRGRGLRSRGGSRLSCALGELPKQQDRRGSRLRTRSIAPLDYRDVCRKEARCPSTPPPPDVGAEKQGGGTPPTMFFVQADPAPFSRGPRTKEGARALHRDRLWFSRPSALSRHQTIAVISEW